VSETADVAVLQQRVKALEEKVQALRGSRRVLMSLIAVQERAARVRITQLEQENKRLQQRNQRFAQAMLEKNARLLRLQEEHGQSWSETVPNLTAADARQLGPS